MAEICIAYDRLRSEEKMLKKEALGMGYGVSMFDVKCAQIDTESKRDAYPFGDVVIERCVSYFRGLYFTASLEFMGVTVYNTLDVAMNCGNKMFTTLLLRKAHVPTPKTYFSFSSAAAREHIEKVGYPIVVKPVIGSWGRGVIPVRDVDTWDAISEMREFADSAHNRIYYTQEMIDRPPRDIRVIMVGDRAVAAMYRRSEGGFKTNLALGADPELCEITPEIEELAARASKAVGGGILGVDMMEDETRGLVVHEVNNTVEFKGLAKVARGNIPRAMIEFVVENSRR